LLPKLRMRLYMGNTRYYIEILEIGQIYEEIYKSWI